MYLPSQSQVGEITMEIERTAGAAKEVVLEKIPGQALGLQFAEAPRSSESSAVAIIVKKIAVGSPAFISGELRSV